MHDNARFIGRIRRRAAREHWPQANRWALAYQSVAMVLINVYLGWLVLHRQLSPISLAVFSLGELILLSLMASAELLPVPRAQRFDGRPPELLGAQEQDGWFGRMFALLLAAIWLSLVYAFALWVDPNRIWLVSDRDALDVLTRLYVLLPLLLAAAVALVAMIGDWILWSRRGGLFVPEMAQPTTPKVLVFFVAPILAVMACFTFIDEDGDKALLAWTVTYLAIRCLFELGMVALQLFGLYIIEGTDDSGASASPAADNA